MNRSSVSLTSESSPIFRISTFRNREVLIFEPIEKISSIRIWMVFICFIIGIITLSHLIMVYMKYKSRLKQGLLYRIIVPLLLFLNILLHVGHYAHNIYDPAVYFEPKYLYVKKFLSEMEQTFFFNFPLSIVFLLTTRKLLLSCTNEVSNSWHMLIVTVLYCLMSVISGGHYTFEPPTNFSFICNVTIAGETILALLLLILSIFIYQISSSKTSSYKYTRLITDASLSSNQERQLKSKMSDDE